MQAKRVSLYGMLLGLSMILSYIEAITPLSIGIPGVKLGLANMVTVTALFGLGKRAAFIIGLLRILLSGWLFGNGSTLLYSAAGFLLSFAVMLGLRLWGGFSMVSVSAAGGAAHNLGQLAAAVCILQSAALFGYLPVLIIAGIISGVVIGVVAGIVSSRISGFI